MKIHWPKTVITVLVPALLLNLALVAGLVAELPGAEGFYGHFVVVAWMGILYPIAIIGAALIVAILVKEKRFIHFLVALGLALLINGTFFLFVVMYGKSQSSKATEQMYADNPMSRAIFDAERPLSIAQPTFSQEGVVSPAEVVVYAKPGVLEDGKSVVEIRSHNFDSIETVLWGSEILTTKKELAPDGERLIYTATVEFNPPENWERGQILVRGTSDSVSVVEISEIRP